MSSELKPQRQKVNLVNFDVKFAQPSVLRETMSSANGRIVLCLKISHSKRYIYCCWTQRDAIILYLAVALCFCFESVYL